MAKKSQKTTQKAPKSPKTPENNPKKPQKALKDNDPAKKDLATLIDDVTDMTSAVEDEVKLFDDKLTAVEAALADIDAAYARFDKEEWSRDEREVKRENEVLEYVERAKKAVREMAAQLREESDCQEPSLLQRVESMSQHGVCLYNVWDSEEQRRKVEAKYDEGLLDLCHEMGESIINLTERLRHCPDELIDVARKLHRPPLYISSLYLTKQEPRRG